MTISLLRYPEAVSWACERADTIMHAVELLGYTPSERNYYLLKTTATGGDIQLPSGRSGSRLYIDGLRLRIMLINAGVPTSCALCGLGEEWQGRRLWLEVDHVDGNNLNNDLANLRFLCSNCHSQETCSLYGKKGICVDCGIEINGRYRTRCNDHFLAAIASGTI